VASERSHRLGVTLILGCAFLASACAGQRPIKAGQQAERNGDYDRAVVEYTNALRAKPDNQAARLLLDRAKLRAAQDHYLRGRRLAVAERYDEAALELQLATELNPSDPNAEAELREVRSRIRTKVAVSRGGKTELQTLVERTRAAAPPGLALPEGTPLPDSLVFSNAPSRMVFSALAKFANLNVIFDPAFREERISADLRNITLADAMASLGATTRTFYRVTAPGTVTIIPDTPGKRREYEEQIVQTFYVSNADLKEVIDLLRVVVDVRQISPVTGVNAIALKDTPERLAAAGRLIAAIDKARPEVIIHVELLQVDRTRLREYGLQVASPGSAGIAGSADANREDMTLRGLRDLTQAGIFVTGVPALYYRLLKNDAATRTLASPHLRASEGMAAQAKFGEKIPVPVTQFAPIATGGINQQPITSYQYADIGVNIDITPRTHHNDEVSLALKVAVSNISGSLGGLPTFGNREISTTIRLKDGETNMLAGLIRDEERTTLAGVPGLSDLPLIGRLFANNHKDTLESDIVLTLTPHIVRVLDLTEAELTPFRMGRDTAGVGVSNPEQPVLLPPRDRDPDAAPADPPVAAPTFPQPGQPNPPAGDPLQGPPGGVGPILPPKPAPVPPVKKGGGGGPR
jgi:general secretion pathway protein D